MPQLILKHFIPPPHHQTKGILGVQILEEGIHIGKYLAGQFESAGGQSRVNLPHKLPLINHPKLPHDEGR
jgi:hypothetical protein